jgi:phosphoserine phosphatase
MIEYNDHVPFFEQVRMDAYKQLYAFDFCKALINIFTSEEEAEHLMTKVAVFRIIAQFLRIKEEQLKAANMQLCSPAAEVMGKH